LNLIGMRCAWNNKHTVLPTVVCPPLEQTSGSDNVRAVSGLGRMTCIAKGSACMPTNILQIYDQDQ
jgi:hypothetical protein